MRTLLLAASILAAGPALAGEGTTLPPLPDAHGFAGTFAGVAGGALLVAGGANFPDKPPWEGGAKAWYDAVYVLERPEGRWKVAGKLPRPLGYGVSASYENGVVCVGGGDASRHYADVFRLDWKDGRLLTTALPALPGPLANASGAMVGGVLYVAGGQERPDAPPTRSVHRLDLSANRPAWEEVEPCPGAGRMLAVAAGFDGAFWLVGGVDLTVGKDGKAERRYLRDAYRHDPEKGWKRIKDLPVPIAAAPSPAPTDESGFFLLGGDDGAQVGTAPARHRGFRKTILRYVAKDDRWLEAGETSAPRVTAPCVSWGRNWVTPSGETRPGVRSPKSSIFRTPEKE